jgi:hypothetical protein
MGGAGVRAGRPRDGVPVTVTYPGRAGSGAGPDFRDAVIRMGDSPARVGDVELHRRAADFARHGHTADPAYDRVVLHVVFSRDGAPDTPTATGRRIPIVVVPPAGAGPAPLREPCAAAPARLGCERAAAVLREAGLWRLRRKAESQARAIAAYGPDQSLYAALAVALGQTANTRPFAALTERAPLSGVMAVMAESAEPDAERDVARHLLHAAGLDGSLLAPAPALPWVIRGIRPAAHPARRVRALAVLLVRLSRPDLVTGARAVTAEAVGAGTRALLDTLTVPADDGPALCGRSRAVELAVNALLPWAAACATLGGDEDGAARLLALADMLPVGERYGAVAHLDRNLRDPRGRSLITTALLQQGALALLHEWCRRGGCGRCPLS